MALDYSANFAKLGYRPNIRNFVAFAIVVSSLMLTNQEFCSSLVLMNKRAKIPEPSLIERLRGTWDKGWQPAPKEPPPAIQIEAADELQRLEYQVQQLKNFIQSKGLFAEFVKSVEPKRKGST